MMFDQWFRQPVSVETYISSGEYGDEYAEPVTVHGMLDDGLVLTHGPGGDVLASSTVLFTDLAHTALFRPESRVTINETVMQVDSAKPRRATPAFRQLEHLEVHLR